jgi:hypothetical protein
MEGVCTGGGNAEKKEQAAMRTINEDEIRQAVFTLHPPDDEEGCLFEVRVIDGSWNLS